MKKEKEKGGTIKESAKRDQALRVSSPRTKGVAILNKVKEWGKRYGCGNSEGNKESNWAIIKEEEKRNQALRVSSPRTNRVAILNRRIRKDPKKVKFCGVSCMP